MNLKVKKKKKKKKVRKLAYYKKCKCTKRNKKKLNIKN